MKCPKCSLVTFDHLAKCPKCGQSFRLQRRLTRVGTAPSRTIQLPGSQTPDTPEARPTATVPPPEATVLESTTTQQQEPAATASSPLPPVMATDLTEPAQPQPETPSKEPRRSIFAADLAPEPEDEPDPLEELVQETAESEAVDPQAADSARLKQRMIHASQKRRQQGPDLVSEAIDPVLPAWYEPSSLEEESDEATVTASRGKR